MPGRQGPGKGLKQHDCYTKAGGFPQLLSALSEAKTSPGRGDRGGEAHRTALDCRRPASARYPRVFHPDDRALGGRMKTSPVLQVYNGRLLVGEIEDRGRGIVAAFKFDRKRRIEIGTYPTRIAAMRAIAMPPVTGDPLGDPPQ
jgi:hypothetical protein